MVAPRQKQPTLALIEELLAEQSRLQTPVAKFSVAHESGSLSQLSTLNSQLSRQLIPLSAPRPGEQYAFEVALDSCTGCKSCVSACHSLNGLDDTETWRDVGLLVGGDRTHPFSQTVTTACHHCADPACLNGCPVLAYEKDPLTGIIRHLDDQCIGCQYCILKCPYDVPKYSTRLGIIRKCDMCHSRLAEGEAPACVQACPTSAIKIVTVLTSDPQLASSFLPTAPDPAYTQPTTRYVTSRAFPPNLAPADAAALRPQHPHWSLVLMLTLLPAAVGLQFAHALSTSVLQPSTFNLDWLPSAAAALGSLGLFASIFHLGQPLRAWRIFLGWRKSWLSREALVFSAWFALTAAAPFVSQLSTLNFQLLRIAAAALGSLGLFCSVMIYVDTRREFWRFALTAPRFFGTAAHYAMNATVPSPSRRAFLSRLLPAKPATPPAPALATPPPATFAVIAGRYCLAYQHCFCSVCRERCPVAGAVVIERGIPRINAAFCNGCRICHDVCPAPTNAIRLIPRPPVPALSPRDA